MRIILLKLHVNLRNDRIHNLYELVNHIILNYCVLMNNFVLFCDTMQFRSSIFISPDPLIMLFRIITISVYDLISLYTDGRTYVRTAYGVHNIISLVIRIQIWNWLRGVASIKLHCTQRSYRLTKYIWGNWYSA